MSVHEEIEVKFILLLSKLLDLVQLEALPKQKIEQAYFSKERIRQYLIPELQKLLPDRLPPEVNYVNGRVRAVEEDGMRSFQITVKGPREDFYSRIEIEVGIDLALYEKLFKLVDEGSVSKTRHFLAGSLYRQGAALPAVAEIDVMHTAGGRTVQFEGVPDFAVVEVEVPDRALIELLQKGSHSFEFLKGAYEIAALPEVTQRTIRMRYFAKYGVDQRVRTVLKELFDKPSTTMG